MIKFINFNAFWKFIVGTSETLALAGGSKISFYVFHALVFKMTHNY